MGDLLDDARFETDGHLEKLIKSPLYSRVVTDFG